MKNNAVKVVVIVCYCFLVINMLVVLCWEMKSFFLKKKLFRCLIPKGSENARDQQEDKGKEQRAWQDRENEKE